MAAATSLSISPSRSPPYHFHHPLPTTESTLLLSPVPKSQACFPYAQRYSAEQNPGDFTEQDQIRRLSAYYYYQWSSAHALRALGKSRLETATGPREWPAELAQALLSHQRADGSWANPYTELREDDPLMATAFAMAALANARIMLCPSDQAYGRSRRSTAPARGAVRYPAHHSALTG
jgi:hypothetical protein